MNNGKPSAPILHGERRRATDEPARARPKDRDPSWMARQSKQGGRHSAITRTLYNFSSYKSWAEKVRNSFDRDK